MSYLVKEIFYTLQGEGAHAGTPAVFLRFAGCNVWSGKAETREQDSRRGACALWCDTDFVGGIRFETAGTLADAVKEAAGECPIVVCTGGEPLLQLDAPLVAALQRRGFRVHLETNGSMPLPCPVDWVCASPKPPARFVLEGADEVKVIYPAFPPAAFEHLAPARFIQPQASNDADTWTANVKAAIAYVKEHPQWRLSLQTHKLLGIP